MEIQTEPVPNANEIQPVLLLAVGNHGDGIGKDAVVNKRNDGKLLFLVVLIVGVEPLSLI